MTIDERLEALTMNLELQAHEGEAQRKRIELLGERIGSLGERMGSLMDLVQKDAENIQALARIAEIHEHRLTHLEGGTA